MVLIYWCLWMVGGGCGFPFQQDPKPPPCLSPGPFLICLSVLFRVLTFHSCSWGAPLARTLGQCVWRTLIPRGGVDESPPPAESWVLEVGCSSRMKAWEVPDKGRSILRFLWVNEEHHWEVGSTPHGPLNPGQAFLLSFLGEGAPGLGDSYWTP